MYFLIGDVAKHPTVWYRSTGLEFSFGDFISVGHFPRLSDGELALISTSRGLQVDAIT